MSRVAGRAGGQIPSRQPVPAGTENSSRDNRISFMLVNMTRFHIKNNIAADQRTRGHRYKLSVPVCRSEVRRRSFGVRCVNVWNSLPGYVVESESLGLFKSRIDLHLAESFFGVL